MTILIRKKISRFNLNICWCRSFLKMSKGKPNRSLGIDCVSVGELTNSRWVLVQEKHFGDFDLYLMQKVHTMESVFGGASLKCHLERYVDR